MLLLNLSFLFLSGISFVSAQHVHFEPPEVSRNVQLMLDKFHKYTNYTGPSPDGLQSSKSLSTRDACDFWMESIAHQGLAAFNPNPSAYQVFRNVKDFGAVGDGVTDDTAAINAAIDSGSRCAPGSCQSSTVTPAVVYFPAGTYLISSSIIHYYYTQLIGNANCLPVIRASPGFSSGSNIGLIDADPYESSGNLSYGATNVFYRQVRNLVLDLTQLPVDSSVAGIHWPTAQATSVQNVQFMMSSAPGTQHIGMFIESGSGGFMNDLTFTGGSVGLNVGNQQFTMRNLTFENVGTAINQLWDWGWTYKGITIDNCQVGIAMGSTDPTSGGQTVGSVILLDSSITNTPIGVQTSRNSTSLPPSGNSLILENVILSNVSAAVQGTSGTLLAGSTGSTTISAWGQGTSYTPTGPSTFQGPISANLRPASLLIGTDYYQRSKPQYETQPVTGFVSARALGAKGDGTTDDTAALQNAINTANSEGDVLFVDHGDYLVTNTIYIPAGSRIVGESYSVILSSGAFFDDMTTPQPVVRLGNAGEAGSVEMSDMIVSTKGQQQGAVLIEYNLVSSSTSPSGIWDVHTRVGGFAGSDLQVAQCPTTAAQPNQDCLAAYLDLHVTSGSSGLYLENNWLWVADHDIEDTSLTQISIYGGRGMLIESIAGNIWLVGTAVEHHTLYQYQFANTQNIFAGQIQTETPYYQPNPPAPGPWPFDGALNDPQFTTQSVDDIPAANAWGLRSLNSQAIFIYGAGLYSFFDNYNTTCSDQGNGETCQSAILSVEGSSSNINVYNLNTVGVHYMLSTEGNASAVYSDNLNGFEDTIALFRSG